jgi:hypothetical protein
MFLGQLVTVQDFYGFLLAIAVTASALSKGAHGSVETGNASQQ